jgi:2-polyprenyl-3-methyl-5-hydroxy-6-metoxy-1,4-benzoquinol methylase
MFRRILFVLINNALINNLAILLGLDRWLASKLHLYKHIKPDLSLSAQEMAGFSRQQSVQEAIDKTHRDIIQLADKYLEPGNSVLDIGCGAGAYLQDLTGRGLHLTGIDLNSSMIHKGLQVVPEAEFFQGEFLTTDFNRKFDLIICISVLEFVPPGELNLFFEKIKSLLTRNGVLFLHYPHALSLRHTLYPDLYYIEYSPRKIHQVASGFFQIEKHEHAFDGRLVNRYDKQAYDKGFRSFKNGYMLLARNSFTLHTQPYALPQRTL